MTKLEKRIYDCAMEILPEAKEHIKEIKTELQYIEIPFMCDGCVDRIVYDNHIGKFTKIKYSKGKGSGTYLDKFQHSAYFDDIELCEINL